MQELSTSGKIALVSKWFKVVLTQIITRVYNEFSHLQMPTKYGNLTSITILIPHG